MPPLRFAAIGLNHPHIYGQTNLLLRAGAELAAFPGQPLEEGGRSHPLSLLLVEPGHAVVHLLHADLVRVEEGTAAVARKAIAVDPDQIDVARPERDAFLQDLRPLVDEGVDASLHDLFLGEGATPDAELTGNAFDESLDRRIGNRRAAAFLVAVEAGSRLLAEASQLADPIGDAGVAKVLRTSRLLALPHRPADVQPREVRHRVGPHGETEVGQRLIHLVGKSAVLEEETT